MNPLIESGVITELQCGGNFSYILKDNSDFKLTEYKVLQSQENDSYVKCMKMLYNGQVQLYYLTNEYKIFQSLINSVDSSNLLKIIANVFSSVLEVKNNGFLSCQNLCISFDKIFVDPSNLQCRLIYQPLVKRSFDDYSSFENELRTSFVKLINDFPDATNEKLNQFAAFLSDGTLSLEDLFAKVKGIKVQTKQIRKKEHIETPKSKGLRIVAMNAPVRLEIDITKNDFILGRSEATADGALTFNKAIGRIHCKITTIGDKYFATDMSSANGTFLNKARLASNTPCELHDGDILRLANSDFQVCMD